MKVLRTLMLVAILFLIFFLVDICKGKSQGIKKEPKLEVNEAKPTELNKALHVKLLDTTSINYSTMS